MFFIFPPSAINILGWYFPIFLAILLLSNKNEKKKKSLKSNEMKFRHKTFGLYYHKKPGGYIMENLSNTGFPGRAGE
jgi:hypothetical protein